MKTPELIFITGHQRSGTTVFRLLLESHGVYNADEIFHGELKRKDRFYEYLYQRVLQDKNLIFPGRHQQVFYDYIGYLTELSQGKPIAADVKYNNFPLLTPPYQLKKDGSFILDYIASIRAPIVHIVRRNKLRIYISELIAKKTGVWGTHNTARITEDRLGLKINIQDMKQKLNGIQHSAETAAKHLSRVGNVHNIVYEDMFDAQGCFAPPVIQLVKDLLKVETVNPEPAHIKINPEALSEIIENYEEVTAALQGTPFEWMAAD